MVHGLSTFYYGLILFAGPQYWVPTRFTAEAVDIQIFKSVLNSPAQALMKTSQNLKPVIRWLLLSLSFFDGRQPCRIFYVANIHNWLLAGCRRYRRRSNPKFDGSPNEYSSFCLRSRLCSKSLSCNLSKALKRLRNGTRPCSALSCQVATLTLRFCGVSRVLVLRVFRVPDLLVTVSFSFQMPVRYISSNWITVHWYAVLQITYFSGHS